MHKVANLWSKVKDALRPGSPYLYEDIGKSSRSSPITYRHPSPGSQIMSIENALNFPKKQESLAKGYYFMRAEINKKLATDKVTKSYSFCKPNEDWFPSIKDKYNLQNYFDKDGYPLIILHKSWGHNIHKVGNPSYTKKSVEIKDI